MHMKRNILTIVLLVAFCLLLVAAYLLYQDLSQTTTPMPISTETPATETEPPVQTQTPDENPEAAPADLAADFVFYDREGTSIRLSELQGKPVVINFWATWCGPCQSELPFFEKAYAEYGDQIQFVMLDLTDGYSETVEKTLRFAEENGYTFPLYFDADGEGAIAYGVYAIPLTVLIDAEGRMVDSHVGAMTEADLGELLNRILN